MAVGLAVTKWPLLINHDSPWPLFEGVETCMLVALSLLAFLGLRYPIKMLPILLFEIGWKFIWVAVVVAPLWIRDQLDQATAGIFYSCLVALIVVVVVPWRYVVTHYVTKRGDPWRPDATRSVYAAVPAPLSKAQHQGRCTVSLSCRSRWSAGLQAERRVLIGE